MVKMMQDETNKLNQIDVVMLDEDVIQLHNIARHIEQTIGVGSLSEDIRRAADRLNELIKRY
jgi:hypothetical protein